MSHPKLTASGHIEAGGISYRVTDDLESRRCTVVRDTDGAIMGSFTMDGLDDVPEKSAVEPGARDPELVLAIARLLALPRGVLPLQ